MASITLVRAIKDYMKDENGTPPSGDELIPFFKSCSTVEKEQFRTELMSLGYEIDPLVVQA